MNTGTTSVYLPALSEAEFTVLGEKVFCDDEIGIEWSEIDSMPDDADMQLRSRQNEKVLRALALFEEHDETRSDDAERAEFHRLEGKVDIVLDLLTAMLRDQWKVSKARNARFNSRGLCWDTSRALDPGGLLDVNCYLLAHWPLPLKLFTRIVDSVPREDQFRVCARIEGLSGVSRDWFNKLVFRRHRRMIAQRRAHG